MNTRTARILFVEDQELIARPLFAALQQAYDHCSWVQSAREMRAIIPTFLPDVLVLDASLETDGLEYFQAIRFSPEHPRCGVIIMTEAGDRVTKEKAQQLGAAGVLGKPIMAEQLISTINELISLVPLST